MRDIFSLVGNQRKTQISRAKNLADWRIQVTKRNKRIIVDTRKYRSDVSKILSHLCAYSGKHPISISAHVSQLSILLTGNREIQKLNREYRGKDKATDVLSFSQLEGEGGEDSECLGDLVISLEQAKLQAKEYNMPLRHELLRLTIHGILHLFGYDHVNVPAAKAARMRRKELELIRELI